MIRCVCVVNFVILGVDLYLKDRRMESVWLCGGGRGKRELKFLIFILGN